MSGGAGEDYSSTHASSKSRRGDRGNSPAGSPWPRLQRKLDRQPRSARNSSSTMALSKPDIAPVSSPSARAARIRYAPCKRAVAKRRGGGERFVAGEPGPRIRIVREQLRQLLVEFRIVGHDHRHRRRHRLVVVAARQRRRQLLLRLVGAQEQEAGRRAVGRGRALLQQVVQLPQLVVGDRLVGEPVVGARLAEQQVKPGGVECHRSEIDLLDRDDLRHEMAQHVLDAVLQRGA